jgi:hypothetical protein
MGDLIAKAIGVALIAALIGVLLFGLIAQSAELFGSSRGTIVWIIGGGGGLVAVLLLGFIGWIMPRIERRRDPDEPGGEA